jgi:hypothetical protein
MTCTRCQGCMAKDHFLDLMESAETFSTPLMERNRLQQGLAVVVSTVREPVQKMEPKNVSMPS